MAEATRKLTMADIRAAAERLGKIAKAKPKDSPKEP
jgi:hypothetical protein